MNNKKIILIAAGVLIIGAITIAATRTPGKNTATRMSNMPASSSAVQAPKDAHSVTIQNYKFDPTPLVIKKGTTVTWTNHDIARHNIVADDGAPAGGPSGPLFGKSETFQFTFNTVGTYTYHCEPHPYMHGTIQVTE